MRRATFLASARDDLLSILSYIASQSGSVAVGKISSRICAPSATSSPRWTPPSDGLGLSSMATIRSFPYRGYLIFFRYVAGRFEVVDILEGHRDVEALFREHRER